VQAGSPYFARQAFWGIESTLRAAGWRTTPYHVDAPSFADWGFALPAPGHEPALRLAAPPGAALRFLDAPTLAAAASFPPDRGPDRAEALDARPPAADRRRTPRLRGLLTPAGRSRAARARTIPHEFLPRTWTDVLPAKYATRPQAASNTDVEGGAGHTGGSAPRHRITRTTQA
jgi:hypothetical protein